LVDIDVVYWIAEDVATGAISPRAGAVEVALRSVAALLVAVLVPISRTISMEVAVEVPISRTGGLIGFSGGAT
jgi:hypothetical protein